MKLEYLSEGSPDCPLIRIFGASRTEFSRLRSAVLLLNRGELISKGVHELEGFHLLNFGQLTMTASDKASGVKRARVDSFNWLNSRSQWALVAGLLEPFSESMPKQSTNGSAGRKLFPR